MQLFNQTKKITIADTVTEAKKFIAKSQGLLGTQTPYAIIFKTRWGIHTFGMKYAIDVLILDKQNIVRVIRQKLKPNNICMWNPKYSIVIELPSESIRRSQTEIGDKIKLFSSPTR